MGRMVSTLKMSISIVEHLVATQDAIKELKIT